MFRHQKINHLGFLIIKFFCILPAILAAILNSKTGGSRCTLARGLIMFVDPENIEVTVGIMSLSAIISEMSINTSMCVGHLGIQYGSHHSDI